MNRRWHRVQKVSIALPADLLETVRAAVSTGRYSSLSEVVREALRDWRTAGGATSIDLTPARHPRPSDFTLAQYSDVALLGPFRRIECFAIRGSARKRVVDAAVRFGQSLPFRWTPEEARRDLEMNLSRSWMQEVRLVTFDSALPPAEWTVVYEDDLPGSDTDSSSTS